MRMLSRTVAVVLGAWLAVALAPGCDGSSGEESSGEESSGEESSGEESSGEESSGEESSGEGGGGGDCASLCQDGQAGGCTDITGDCGEFCAALDDVAPRAGCGGNVDDYIDCLNGGADICALDCESEESAMNTCLLTFCSSKPTDESCLALAANLQ
jgi:hypothetical protein